MMIIDWIDTARVNSGAIFLRALEINTFVTHFGKFKKIRNSSIKKNMDSIERILRATPLPINLPYTGNGQSAQRALVHASLATAVGRKGRHLTGTFCLTGDTMEGIIQCLVFLKAFSVSLPVSNSSIGQIFCFRFVTFFNVFFSLHDKRKKTLECIYISSHVNMNIIWSEVFVVYHHYYYFDYLLLI